MDLEISSRSDGGYTVVTPHGEIDLSSVELFRDYLNELLIQGRVHLLVDFDDTSFLDSLAVGALIGARRKAQAFNGSVGIVCSNERLLKLFKVTQLDRIFTITASVEDHPARTAAETRRPS
jgi:anti-sigma B factor antagonist